MSAKIETVTIPGLPFPVRAVVVQGNGFTAYRMKGKEVHRVVHAPKRAN